MSFDYEVKKKYPKLRIACEFCGNKYERKDSLRRHIAATHDVSQRASHQCEICDGTFQSKYSLKRHKQRKHSTQTGDLSDKNRSIEEKDHDENPVEEQWDS